jgi:hypothetical protein
MQKLIPITVSFGADPEFFFTKGKSIIGAEKILPEEGMGYSTKSDAVPTGNGTVVGDDPTGKIIIDGVQAELNPRPNTCRANLGNEISLCFRELYKKLDKDVNIDFSPTVTVSKKEMDSLSDKSKEFGCGASKNVHASLEESMIRVDPTKYMKRSAGGHIHIGNSKGSYSETEVQYALDNPKKLVTMYDILVGNTCVMLDRDPGNKERRKNYGRAGEYRTPKHGIEYRTLSNFWLKSYKLMSLVTGLMRSATSVVASGYGKDCLVEEFTKRVNMKHVEKAINTNNFDLAKKNFDKIKDLFMLLQGGERDHPFHSENIKYFEHFIEKGLDYWFKEDPFDHWVKLPEGHGTGRESFLDNTVKHDTRKS